MFHTVRSCSRYPKIDVSTAATISKLVYAYQPRIYSSVWDRFAILLDIIEHAIRNLEDSLVYNIARGPKLLVKVILYRKSRCIITYWTPNLSSLKRLGILSTTCSFTAGPLERTGSMPEEVSCIVMPCYLL